MTLAWERPPVPGTNPQIRGVLQQIPGLPIDSVPTAGDNLYFWSRRQTSIPGRVRTAGERANQGGEGKIQRWGSKEAEQLLCRFSLIKYHTFNKNFLSFEQI
jgi:hypothetical protein